VTVHIIGQKQKVLVEIEIDRTGNLSTKIRLSPNPDVVVHYHNGETLYVDKYGGPKDLTVAQKVAMILAQRIKFAVTSLMRDAVPQEVDEQVRKILDGDGEPQVAEGGGLQPAPSEQSGESPT
jgi:hypothetical protein